MTCREKLTLEHPEALHSWEHGGCTGCPSTYGYLEDPADEFCGGEENCTRCWDREIPGTLPMDKTVYEAAKKLADSALKTGVAVGNAAKALTENMSKIKDSGDRTEFETGAVRDMREGKGRCDLMPLRVVGLAMKDPMFTELGIFLETLDTSHLYNCLTYFSEAFSTGIEAQCWCTMFLEVAKHFEEGAKKYGENNWQKGIPVHCYIDSAVRHYLKWLRGDKDEPHDRAFCWNLMCCIWEVDYRPKDEEKNDLLI